MAIFIMSMHLRHEAASVMDFGHATRHTRAGLGPASLMEFGLNWKLYWQNVNY